MVGGFVILDFVGCVGLGEFASGCRQGLQLASKSATL